MTIEKLTPVPRVPPPKEAEDYPLHYLWAEEIKPGDYLIIMGEYKRVNKVTHFPPYSSIQIIAGGINYARSNKHRSLDQFWVLVSPFRLTSANASAKLDL